MKLRVAWEKSSLEAHPVSGAAGLEVGWGGPWSTKELEDVRRSSSVVHGSSRSYGFQAILNDQLKGAALSGEQAHLKRRTYSKLRIALAKRRAGEACFSTPALQKIGG